MEEARLQLRMKLAPADGEPADPAVLDDIVRLIRQGIATAPKEVATVTPPRGGFRDPPPERAAEVERLTSQIKQRIEQASAASQSEVERVQALRQQPDGEQQLREEARHAAEMVVKRVQAALIRGIAVRVPDDGPPPA